MHDGNSTKAIFWLIAFTLIAIFFTGTARAGLIHQYSFEITAVNGPLEGTSGSGTFTYDDRGLGGNRLLGLPFETFAFDWNNQLWGPGDVLFGSVWLSPDGSINFDEISSFFGSSCIVGQCGVTAGTLQWNLEIFGGAGIGGVFGGEIFRYATTNDGGFGIANGVVSIVYEGIVGSSSVIQNTSPASVPAPGTIGLFLIGLAALSYKRRHTLR